jgi:TonB family protein
MLICGSSWNLNTVRLATGTMVLLGGLAQAQTDDYALLLLREVESSAQTTKSWRAEGVEMSQMTGRGMNLKSEVNFRVAAKYPLKMHRENSGDDHTQWACDGTDKLYTGDGYGFYRSPAAVSNDCNFSLSDFYKLEENPVSATVAGRDHLQLAGGARECEVIRAEFNRAAPGGALWHSVRTMCIDTVQHVILRDSTESTDARSDMRSTRTVTITSFERDPSFSGDAFEFSIPTGAIEDQGPQMGMDAPVPIDGIYPIGPHISYPRLISKVEPVYTEEARQSRVSGLVLISLEVTQDGAPRNLKIVRRLGRGLDEKAIEAVHQWRFNAGTKDGVPVAVGPVVVAVGFRLP